LEGGGSRGTRSRASGASVHPSAVVEADAVLGPGVVIGPLCYVAAGVAIGVGSELVAQATLLGPTRLGANNRVFPHAVLGAPPQDRSYAGEPTRLEIGDGNEFREHVTVHRGTLKGGGVTRVGSRCLLMAGAHVAHDCQLGNEVVLTNLATLGGHVTVGDNAVCGGLSAVAQYVRLGRACFLAGGAMVEKDVPPFVIAAGDRARVRALNQVGLERLGVPDPSRRALRDAFRAIWRSREPRAAAIARLRDRSPRDPLVDELLDFLERAAALKRP
jgi:UDP-N-acetylglucosamine acyltransferase